MAAGVVGAISWELTLPGCTSLKEKRSVVRSLKDRLRARFRASVAETGHHEALARAVLSAALVSPDAAFAESVLDKMDAFVQRDGRALVASTSRELFRW